MSYNVDFKLENDTISQRSTFIPRTQDLTIRLNTTNSKILNAKIVLNNKDFYMTRTSKNTYTIKLHKNMCIVGNNNISFVLEFFGGKFIETNTLPLTLFKDNIIQADFNYIEYLIATLNKTLTKLDKETNNENSYRE